MQEEKALQLVSLAQAQKLKELGFDWEVTNCYLYKNHSDYISNIHTLSNNQYKIKIDWNNDCYKDEYVEGIIFSAPSVSLALKWFRDVKGVPNSIDSEWYDGSIKIAYIIKYFETENETDCESDYEHYSTYEEAESALLDALIEYCEEENK